MSFDPSKFIGQFGAFYLKPLSVDRCLPRPGVKRQIGECIGAKSAPASRGIPDATLTFRGRSGRVASVSYVDCYVQLFPTWKAAIDNANT
jgi:hypothetical protein